MRVRSLLKRLTILLLLLTASALARVERVEITSRQDVLQGRAFGAAGVYEKITGKVYFAVDPGNPHNRQIVDLERADRNPRGEVEFSADFYLLRPKDPARGNGAMLFEVSNRGGKGMVTILQRATPKDRAAGLDPTTAADFGDGFLMDRGYTLAWVGWQADVPPAPSVLRLYAPIAYGPHHRHLTGLVRADFTPLERVASYSLAHIINGTDGGDSYKVSDPEDARNVLTVRDTPEGKRTLIPRSRWRFGADRHSVELDGGFEQGRIYEVVYVAQDPVVAGLGLAAVRDFLSYAKYDPQAPAPVKRVYAMGVSQSGRFLRHFLYQDFQSDERGRQVMDGVLAHVAGAGRGSFNHRFAQPSRDSEPMLALFYPTDLFPFTDLPESDPVSGRRDGLEAHTSHPPKIFYSNTSHEYWGRVASLIHTSADGKTDYKIPDNVRIYFFAGLQHFTSPFPPAYGKGELMGQNRLNSNPIVWYWRAMITAMDAWVAQGIAPPASVYPHLNDGTLVERRALKFPSIPGVRVPESVQRAYHLDFGPEFLTRGIVSIEPPKVGPAFPVFVPQVDADGNDLGGVRGPELQAPLATYTGWNLRSPEIGAPAQRNSFVGSYLPFARTAAERRASADPRLSIAERYSGKEEYMKKYQAAAAELIRQRFFLASDLPLILERGRAEWEEAAK